MELAECVRALERRQNLVYQLNFVRGLKARMRRKAACHPGRFPLEPLRSIWTVRQFDEVYTAPHFGFRNASDYYYRASAMRVIDRVRIPTLIITAEDDPFVPSSPFRDRTVVDNPNLRVVVTPQGGHCAFVTESRDGYDGYWAEHEILAFAKAHASTATPSGVSQTPVPGPALRV
jgi:uncharacterized protein